MKAWREDGVVLQRNLNTPWLLEAPEGLLKSDFRIRVVRMIDDLSFQYRYERKYTVLLLLAHDSNYATNPNRVSTTTSSKETHNLETGRMGDTECR